MRMNVDVDDDALADMFETLVIANPNSQPHVEALPQVVAAVPCHS